MFTYIPGSLGGVMLKLALGSAVCFSVPWSEGVLIETASLELVQPIGPC